MVSFKIFLDHEGLISEWSKPKTRKYGVYIFRSDAKIIRVGESSSGCDRISKGFKQRLRHVRRGKERKNYLAYSWRERHAGKSIAVDFFNLPEDPFSDSHTRRSLEAELTFQIRIFTGQWPDEMSEIHFLESKRCDPHVISQVTRILGHYGHAYRGDI